MGLIDRALAPLTPRERELCFAGAEISSVGTLLDNLGPADPIESYRISARQLQQDVTVLVVRLPNGNEALGQNVVAEAAALVRSMDAASTGAAGFDVWQRAKAELGPLIQNDLGPLPVNEVRCPYYIE